MNSLSILFNTRIEVSTRAPEERTEFSLGPYSPVDSLADKIRGAADHLLAPVRYLFNGQTVCLEKDDDNPWKAGHVTSYTNEVEHGQCIELSRTLESSQKSWLKTILAIVFLIPAIFAGLIIKLPAYLFAQTREYHTLTLLHFTPTNMELGKDQPFKTCQEILSALIGGNPLARPVDALIIHATPFDVDVQNKDEKRILLSTIPEWIYLKSPKKVIFIGMKEELCTPIFSNQANFIFKKTFCRSYTEKSLDEALKAKIDTPRYYVLNPK